MRNVLIMIAIACGCGADVVYGDAGLDGGDADVVCYQVELCNNGIDDDCNGYVNDGCACAWTGDEVCGDGIDNDCDGTIDEGC